MMLNTSRAVGFNDTFKALLNEEITSVANKVKFASQKNNYSTVLVVTELVNETFKARIKLYNELYASNKKPELIYDSLISGTLNKENKYTFEGQDLPNLEIELNIDKVFTLEEIKARFKNNQLQ